ncbi:NlpC/P60 family protein, partial [Bacillus thuringiensis]
DRYYLDANNGGSMKTGWVNVEGKYYYLDTDSDPNKIGVMKTGWLKDNDRWYYLDANNGGSMKTGWFQEGDAWYYLDANQGGSMVTGQATIEGKTYTFAADGKWSESESSGIIDLALKQLGKPYVFGNSGPNSFDCSGFIYYVFKNNGYNIGRTSVAGYWGMVTKISNPQPGDLVFLQNTYKAGPSHMGIYLGNGEFIHAADERTGVTKGNVNSQYNREHFLGYGRFTK